MNDQDFRFLPFFLREAVYVVPEPAPVPIKEPAPLPAWLGKGEQPILLLVNEPEHEFLAPHDQAFLEKILRAVSLSLDDIMLINQEHAATHVQQGTSWDELLADLVYQTSIVFGEVPDHWSQSQYLEKYTVKQGADARQWLLADTLSVIAHDTDKKARLWKCLQQLFV